MICTLLMRRSWVLCVTRGQDYSRNSDVTEPWNPEKRNVFLLQLASISFPVVPSLLFLELNDHCFHQSICLFSFTNHHQVIDVLSFVCLVIAVRQSVRLQHIYWRKLHFSSSLERVLILCSCSSRRLPLCPSTSLPPLSRPSSTRASSRSLRPPAARSITLVSASAAVPCVSSRGHELDSSIIRASWNHFCWNQHDATDSASWNKNISWNNCNRTEYDRG